MSQPIPPATPNPPRPGATTPAPPVSSLPPTRLKRLQLYAICVLAGLLVGLVPTSLSLYQARRERDQAQSRVRAAELELGLSRSAVLARHGDYNAARDAASDFFSRAGQELDAASSDLTAAELNTLRSLLADRDTAITLLARSDPAGADRMAAMYLAYRAATP